VVQLDTSFPYTLNRDDFTVNATDENDSTYVRFLKVNAVDDSAKTLTVKFGGAESSNFILSVRHNTYGLLKAYERILDVGGYVTGISPVSGSIYMELSLLLPDVTLEMSTLIIQFKSLPMEE